MAQRLHKLEAVRAKGPGEESEKAAKIHALEHQTKALQDVHAMYMKEKQNYEQLEIQKGALKTELEDLMSKHYSCQLENKAH
jgi:hypothetical protein